MPKPEKITTSPALSEEEKARQHIAVRLCGGIGDQLIGCNYLYHLAKKFPKLRIDVYARKEIHGRFIDAKKWNGTLLEPCKNIPEHYDAIIQLDRYPHVISLNGRVLPQLDGFSSYVSELENFRQKYSRFFDYGTRLDGMTAVYSIIMGKKRIQQADINNILGIGEEFSYELPYAKTDVCQVYGLMPGKFITIHRGCDANHTANSIKLWPQEYYDTLVAGIKALYPDITVVQLGVNEERCPAMKNIDRNLVGKTSLDDVLVILKNSVLHIDSEGGFVHMRHALKAGKSIVLFGATSKEFYGYSENINLRSSLCPMSCEHVMEKWDTYCHISRSESPACMRSLLPEDVLSAVVKELRHV